MHRAPLGRRFAVDDRCEFVVNIERVFRCRFVQTENRATEAERTVSKLQKEIDRLEGTLLLPTELFYRLLLLFQLRQFNVRTLHRTVHLAFL